MALSEPYYGKVMIVSLLLVAALSTAATSSGDGLDRLVGRWACSGHFVQNQRPLAALITATRDAGTGALLLHHDDASGGRYKSLEVWSASTGRLAMRASISDASGMRWFQSAGWNGDRLDWDRVEGSSTVERFSYSFTAKGDLQIDWSRVRDGQPLALGDILICRKFGGLPR